MLKKKQTDVQLDRGAIESPLCVLLSSCQSQEPLRCFSAAAAHSSHPR